METAGSLIGPVHLTTAFNFAMSQGPVKTLFLIAEGFIALGFLISVIYEIIKIGSGSAPNFVNVLLKYAGLYILFAQAPVIVNWLIEDVIYEQVDVNHLSQQFDQLDKALDLSALSQVQGGVDTGTDTNDPSFLSKAYEAVKNGAGKAVNYTINFNLTFMQEILSFCMTIFMKGILLIVAIVAYFFFYIVWPLFFTLGYIGLTAAITLASFPGGGGAVKNWLLCMFELATWPMIFNLVVLLICNGFSQSLLEMRIVVSGTVAASVFERYLANGTTLMLAIGYMAFLIVIIVMVPKIAHTIFRADVHTSFSGLASSVLGVGATAMSAGGAYMAQRATRSAATKAMAGAAATQATASTRMAKAMQSLSTNMGNTKRSLDRYNAARSQALNNWANSSGGKKGSFHNLPGVPADVQKNFQALKAQGHPSAGKMGRAINNLSSSANTPKGNEKLAEIRDWQQKTRGDAYEGPKSKAKS